MTLTRRDLFSLALATGGEILLRRGSLEALSGRPDVTLRIARAQIEIASGHSIATTVYNGGAPGPVLHLREGRSVHVEIVNETDREEYVHWHGLIVPARVDGTQEENSLPVPAHGRLTYVLPPQRTGVRYVHSHAMARQDLNRGTYSGQFSFVYVEPRNNPGRYDQELFISTHEWEPYLTNDELEEQSFEPIDQQVREQPALAEEMKHEHWEIGYKSASINGKALGHGEPLRVKEGQRLLFHVLNASATENIRLSLPGHRFLVVALDGNAVPRPALVDILELGVGERVDAVVEMQTPGVWIFGSNDDVLRDRGMGIVVEYAGKIGPANWTDPAGQDWDYSLFSAGLAPEKIHATMPMVISSAMGNGNRFEQWLINGRTHSGIDKPTTLKRGERCRFAFQNKSDDAHPLHFHRTTFEMVRIDGRPVTGLRKDVFLLKPFGSAEVDLAPTEPGLMLFHCHNQFHMDSGFKRVFNVV